MPLETQAAFAVACSISREGPFPNPLAGRVLGGILQHLQFCLKCGWWEFLSVSYLSKLRQVTSHVWLTFKAGACSGDRMKAPGQ